MGLIEIAEDEVRALLDAADAGDVRPEIVEQQIARLLRLARMRDSWVSRVGNRLTVHVRGVTIRHTTARPARVHGDHRRPGRP